MLNTAIVAGRLTKDVELRHTNSGKSVCSFTLAVDRDFKNQAGEKETDFIDCVAFGHSAEFLSNYAAKGQVVMATGRLQVREWTDKEGNKRRNAEIIVSNVYFGERRTKAFSEDDGFKELDDQDGDLPF